jgi:hypothetical protein
MVIETLGIGDYASRSHLSATDLCSLAESVVSCALRTVGRASPSLILIGSVSSTGSRVGERGMAGVVF